MSPPPQAAAPTLVAVMLCGLRKSIQAELDEFFGHLRQQAGLARDVSEQAFASARAKLADAALPYLGFVLQGLPR
ncbi:hypothetical protein [Trinickia sp. LjRoot230]|uniref:hypothetical protein n=1 Tax=Trinickia sp. LjRoot230 TaxID=3342288 RepID=UPI003F4FE6D0